MMTDAKANYKNLLAEINDIAGKSRRDPKSIQLVAVSKNHSWNAVSEIYEAGCRTFGENRVQEALPKIVQAPSDINWHLIGPLQLNKVRKAVGRFALIHSVDSLSLAKKISEVSLESSLITSILLQVNTSGELAKQGFTASDCKANFNKINELPGIKVEGLMTMAPFTQDEKIIRNCFAELRNLSQELKIKHLSMGMSNDYRIAIEEGATILRVGTAIFQ